MKRFLTGLLSLALASFASAVTTPAQNTNGGTAPTMAPVRVQNTNAKKRGPVFRANKDQVKQAQAILKQRGFYAGEQTGKLDADTRAGLRKYQAAENIKVTGTLNRQTLEKMNIALTDKQKAM